MEQQADRTVPLIGTLILLSRSVDRDHPRGCICGAGTPCICSEWHHDHPSQRRVAADRAIQDILRQRPRRP
jgi:hypothetical protein